MFGACLILVLIKIPFLDLPYFWDEAWVYAPAVFDMFENGPSLSPDSIDPLLSRGHPILFHFFAVCWMEIFGTSFVAVHSFSLFIAVLLIWAIHALGTALANKQIGFWAAVIFTMQPLFVQQSGFLLPELQLALFVILTILFYIKRKPLLYILSGTAMLMTKETGVLVIGVIGLLELFAFLQERDFSRKRWWEFIATGLPVVITFGYFLVQYMQFGWFMFPEHMSMFETDPDIWRWKRGLVFSTVFLEQQRQILVAVALAVGAFGWERGPKLLRVLFLMCALSFMTMNGLESWLPNWFFLYTLPILIGVTVVWTSSFLFREGTKNHLFILFVGLIVPFMLLFTSAHFITGRYLLYLFPLVILVVVLVSHVALKHARWLFHVQMVCLGLMFYHFVNRADAKMNIHDNLKYVGQIQLLQEGIAYLSSSGAFDECIAGSFLVQQALTYPVQGYVKEDNRPDCVRNHIPIEANYVMLISYEIDAGLEWVKTDPDFECVFSSKKESYTTWVYKRRNMTPR